jgi:hypothetical protein
VALLSKAEQDIEEPTLLTIVPADAAANLWEPGTVGKIEMFALGSLAPFRPSADHFRKTPTNGHRQTGPAGPVGAISGRKPGRGQASKTALAWQSDLSYKVRHKRFACHGA